MRSSFSDDELLVVAREFWPGDPSIDPRYTLIMARHTLDEGIINEFTVKLAQTYPNKIKRIFGKGWRTNSVGEWVWNGGSNIGYDPFVIVSKKRGLLGGFDWNKSIPVEFDQALNLGRRLHNYLEWEDDDVE